MLAEFDRPIRPPGSEAAAQSGSSASTYLKTYIYDVAPEYWGLNLVWGSIDPE
jgi:hypothetical protein